MIAIVCYEGVNVEGIFRRCCVKKHGEDMREFVDSSDEPVKVNACSPLVAATVLKRFFAEIPESLLGSLNWTEWQKIIKTSRNEEEKISKAQNLLDLMPAMNKRLLAFLLHTIKLIADKNVSNKMTIQNLAICWAPNLLHTPLGAPSSPDDCKTAQEVVSLIFEKCMNDFMKKYEVQIQQDIVQAWLDVQPSLNQEINESKIDAKEFKVSLVTPRELPAPRFEISRYSSSSHEPNSSRTPTTLSISPHSISPTSSSNSIFSDPSPKNLPPETHEHYLDLKNSSYRENAQIDSNRILILRPSSPPVLPPKSQITSDSSSVNRRISATPSSEVPVVPRRKKRDTNAELQNSSDVDSDSSCQAKILLPTKKPSYKKLTDNDGSTTIENNSHSTNRIVKYQFERTNNIERSATTSGPHDFHRRDILNKNPTMMIPGRYTAKLRRGSSQNSTVSSGSNTIVEPSRMPTPPNTFEVSPQNSSLEDVYSSAKNVQR